jgi:hypothetical protein
MLWKNFKQYRSKKKESGQALTEFVLGLMIVISFFFFYVKMAAVFAVGSFIHYATFMSARAYTASAANEEIQRVNAETVLQKMVGTRFKNILTGTECGAGCPAEGMPQVVGARVGAGPFAQEDPANNPWNQGVTYSYKAKLSLYPWNKENDSLNMKMVSESWMPREESEAECVQTKAKVQGMLGSNGQNILVEWDNGC